MAPLGGRLGVRECTWLSREHSRSPIYLTGVILLVMIRLFSDYMVETRSNGDNTSSFGWYFSRKYLVL